MLRYVLPDVLGVVYTLFLQHMCQYNFNLMKLTLNSERFLCILNSAPPAY